MTYKFNKAESKYINALLQEKTPFGVETCLMNNSDLDLVEFGGALHSLSETQTKLIEAKKTYENLKKKYYSLVSKLRDVEFFGTYDDIWDGEKGLDMFLSPKLKEEREEY